LAKADKFLENFSKKGELLSIHDKYEYFDDALEMDFVLIKNTVNTKMIVPELHQIDYFLFVSNNDRLDIHDLKARITNAEGVAAIYVVDLDMSPSLLRINPFH
jgi:hypothetical protein